MVTKYRLFSALLLENLLLSVICCLLDLEFKLLQCGLLHPVSLQPEQFMLFQIRRVGPLALKYFLLSFNGTLHPLG